MLARFRDAARAFQDTLEPAYDPSWGHPVEQRESQPFTDAVVAAITAGVGGESVPGDVQAIGALEVAAGLWARSFASAKVEPETAATVGLTAPILALIGRELCRRGECVLVIHVAGGGVQLIPAGTWDVRGGPLESSWWYRADVFGASRHETRFVPSPAVVHARYAVDPVRPWLGISPLSWARQTGQLAANLETRLAEETSAPVGSLIAIPSEHDGGDGDDETDPLYNLKRDLRNAKGRQLLVETTAAGWGSGKGGAPMSDWKQKRFGAEPPTVLGSLRGGASDTVLAACGLAPVLASASAGDRRESWRQFLHGLIQPLAALVVTELRVKLDEPALRLDFSALMASDLVGRARAFQSMVKAGIELPEAAAISGLIAADD